MGNPVDLIDPLPKLGVEILALVVIVGLGRGRDRQFAHALQMVGHLVQRRICGVRNAHGITDVPLGDLETARSGVEVGRHPESRCVICSAVDPQPGRQPLEGTGQVPLPIPEGGPKTER